MQSTRSLARGSAFARAWAIAAVAITVASLALASGGCASIAGVQDVEMTFPVGKPPGDSFFGWNEVKIDLGAITVNKATLVAATLDVTTPEGTPDLSFFKDLKVELVRGAQRTTAATSSAFPAGEQAVPLKIQYAGDVVPFLDENKTIRLEWTGHVNPGFTGWTATGFEVRARVKVDIE
jgi:hypothetical protein